MYFIDTHTHIYLPEFDDDRNIIIQRAKDSNVEIWHAQKSLTYIQEDVWEDALSVRLGVWYPKENRFLNYVKYFAIQSRTLRIFCVLMSQRLRTAWRL